MSNISKLKKLELQLENAYARYSEAMNKPYYNLTDEKRVFKQIENWSIRIDDLELKISELAKKENENFI
jgi:hypothetical protein